MPAIQHGPERLADQGVGPHQSESADRAIRALLEQVDVRGVVESPGGLADEGPGVAEQAQPRLRRPALHRRQDLPRWPLLESRMGRGATRECRKGRYPSDIDRMIHSGAPIARRICC